VRSQSVRQHKGQLLKWASGDLVWRKVRSTRSNLGGGEEVRKKKKHYICFVLARAKQWLKLASRLRRWWTVNEGSVSGLNCHQQMILVHVEGIVVLCGWNITAKMPQQSLQKLNILGCSFISFYWNCYQATCLLQTSPLNLYYGPCYQTSVKLISISLDNCTRLFSTYNHVLYSHYICDLWVMGINNTALWGQNDNYMNGLIDWNMHGGMIQMITH
jgi:hypothetical protein